MTLWLAPLSETTDEEMTVAPGKGATEATVVSQPDAEGGGVHLQERGGVEWGWGKGQWGG